MTDHDTFTDEQLNALAEVFDLDLAADPESPLRRMRRDLRGDLGGSRLVLDEGRLEKETADAP